MQGELELALTRLMGREVQAVFAGRTDSGVHAAGQVASLPDERPDLPDWTVAKALNAELPDDLAVTRVRREPVGFHARYDAKWRAYRYLIWSGSRQPLASGQVWVRPTGLVIDEMAEAARRLIGEYDVAAFAGGGEGVPWSSRQERMHGTVRRIYLCEVVRRNAWWGPPGSAGTLIEVRIAANGFLPRMVRNITGALVEVGRGARPVSWIEELRESRDRRQGPMAAPAEGLTLWRVGYGNDDPLHADWME